MMKASKVMLILLSGPLLICPLTVCGFIEGLENRGLQNPSWLLEMLQSWLLLGILLDLVIFMIAASWKEGWWHVLRVKSEARSVKEPKNSNL